MARRKLNQQQLRRISSNQKARGRQSRLPDDSDTADLGNGIDTPGLVICHYGQQLDIESLADDSRGQVFRCFQRSNLPPLVTGDQVVWHPHDGKADADGTGVVVALSERKSILSRPNAHGELRPVAANIDRILITIAPLPQPFDKLIDRYLVAAEAQGLEAVLLLNKQDLLEMPRDQDIPPMLARYQQIGYPVLEVSTHTGAGLDQLKSLLSDATAVFVGQSGVGKSSLINALRGDSVEAMATEAAVGALSHSHDKGTHTTTATRLYHLPDSGDLVDSPGIREFGLWHMDQQTLINGFVEFRDYIGMCKFRDCSHQGDPGCALQDAVAAGKISRERLDSYFHTLGTLNQNQGT